MKSMLSPQALTELGVRVAVLGLGREALAVRFRVRDGAVECRVPIWSGVVDLLEQGPTEATLVAAAEAGPFLRWLLLRGIAALVPHPDWGGLCPPFCDRVQPDDLYRLVRLEPGRIERVDEERGWASRETADL